MNRLIALLGLSTALTACVVIPEGTSTPSPKTPTTTTQVNVPVIIAPQVDNKPKENTMHVCTLSAFTETYRAEDVNRGKAKLAVKKQCVDEFDEMFCQDKDIRCTEYQ